MAAWSLAPHEPCKSGSTDGRARTNSGAFQMTIIQPTPAEKNFLNRAEECKSLSQEINRRLAKLKRRDEIPYIVGLYDRNNLEKLQEVKETLDQRDREAAAAEKSAIPKPLTPAEEIDRLSRLHKENREK